METPNYTNYPFNSRIKKNSTCACVRACVRECIFPGDQKRASDPPDLELQIPIPPCKKGSQPLSISLAPQ